MSYQSGYQNQYEYSNVPSSDDNNVNVNVNAINESDVTNANSNGSSNYNVNIHHNQQQQQQQQGYTASSSSSSPYPPRAYLPTYHEYMQSNTTQDDNNNRTYYNFSSSSGGIGGAYAASTAAASYYFESQRRSRKNKIIIGCAALFFLFLISHNGHGSRNDSRSGIHNSNNRNKNDIGTNGEGKVETFHNVNNNNGNDDDKTNTNTNSNTDTKEETQTNNQQPSSATPKLTYLLTYPMSGTTYTMELIQKATNVPIATNNDRFYPYHELDVSTNKNVIRPITKDYPNLLNKNNNNNSNIGYPFWTESYQTFNHNNNLPSNTILTLSHCSGYCMSPCSPNEYIHTLSSFEESCRQIISHDDDNNDNEETTTTTTTTTTNTNTSYIPKNDIQGIIHLIRDPLSNIVSRFHEYINLNPNYLEQLHSQNPNQAKTPKDNFQSWCSDIDNNTILLQQEKDSNLLSHQIKSMMINIPCHSEFIKYISWHNLVVEMSHTGIGIGVVGSSNSGTSGGNSNINAIQVYFEDYDNVELKKQDVTNIINYLGYNTSSSTTSTTVDNLPTFTGGKLYRQEYYTEEQIEALTQFIQFMAYDQTWELLKRYF